MPRSGFLGNSTIVFSSTREALAILFASPNTHERVASPLAASVRPHNAFDSDRSDGKPARTHRWRKNWLLQKSHLHQMLHLNPGILCPDMRTPPGRDMNSSLQSARFGKYQTARRKLSHRSFCFGLLQQPLVKSK